jgi:hypothetical protein
MAIRIAQRKITLAPRGVAWTVWIKALLLEVCPETVNIGNVKNQPSPLDSRIAMFEVQNRVAMKDARRST